MNNKILYLILVGLVIFSTVNVSMCTANEKLSSDLVKLINSKSTNALLNSEQNNEEQVHVYITLTKGNDTKKIEPFVNKLSYWDGENSIADAWVNVNKLQELANIDNVKSIRSVQNAVINSYRQEEKSTSYWLEIIKIMILLP